MDQFGRKFTGLAIAVVLVAAILGALVDGEVDIPPGDLRAASEVNELRDVPYSPTMNPSCSWNDNCIRQC